MRILLNFVLIFSFFLGTMNFSFAQDAADRKIQAGMILQTGLNFGKSGTKLMKSDGAGTEYSIGVNLNYSMTNTIGFHTGLEVDFERLNYKPNTESATYYYYDDTEILNKEDTKGDETLYLLESRVQRPVYLTIPTMLIFRTKFFGYMRYFGKFGMRSSFLMSQKIDDKGFNMTINNPPTGPVSAKNERMKAPGDMFFFKTAVGLSGGMEWNFSGSTSLVTELGYYYGFVPLHVTQKEKNMTLFTSGHENGTDINEYFGNKSTQSQLLLKLSILF